MHEPLICPILLLWLNVIYFTIFLEFVTLLLILGIGAIVCLANRGYWSPFIASKNWYYEMTWIASKGLPVICVYCVVNLGLWSLAVFIRVVYLAILTLF